MPDKRTHRGPHPSDTKLFAAGVIADLRTALADFSLLLTKGYAGNLMGIDTFSEDQYSFVLDDRKKALKNYIQALISIQEDPALHIKKLSEKLAKMYVNQK